MNFTRDFSYSLRLFFKNFGSSALSVLVLTLGIGISIAMFALVNGIKWSQVDGGMRGELVIVRWQPQQGSTLRNRSINAADFREFKKHSESFASLAGFGFHYESSLRNPNSDMYTQEFRGIRSTYEFFDVIKTKPLMGRTFLEEDVAEGAQPVMVISYRVWQELYSGADDVIGQLIEISGRAHRIIGVMPQGFGFPLNETFWFPEAFPIVPEKGRGAVWKLLVYGILNEGVTAEEATAELNTIAARLAQDFPDTNENLTSLEVSSFNDLFTGNLGTLLWVLLGCSILVVLIASANVSNMIIARTLKRTFELTLRNSFGASRKHIFYQVILDAFIIALFGTIGGTILAGWGSRIIWAEISANRVPYWWHMDINWQVSNFVVCILVFATLASSLIPALRAARTDTYSVLKDDSRTSTGVFAGKITASLVTLQIALSALLLMVAMIVLTIQYRLTNREYTIEPHTILAANLPLNWGAGFTNDEIVDRFTDNYKIRLEKLPGVEEVAFGLGDGISRTGLTQNFKIVGRDYADKQELPTTGFNTVSPEYFEMMNLKLLSGRLFNQLDNRENQLVCIVNKTFADLYFEGENPLGQQIQIQKSPFGGAYFAFRDVPTYTVVGISTDPRPERLEFESARSYASIFVPYRQRPFKFVDVLIKGRGDMEFWTRGLRTELTEMYPGIAPTQIGTIQDRLDQQFRFNEFFLSLFSVFGASALLMASVGLYAVMSFQSSQRKRENGIRMALGASKLDVIRSVVRRGWLQLVVGLPLGIGMGQYLSTVIKENMGSAGMATGLGPPALVLFTVGAVALIAMLVPALIASMSSPVKSLRVD